MSLKGYSDEKKSADGAMKHVTMGRIGADQIGLDVRKWAYVLAASDAVEAGSTERVINATGHSARVGDLISITSGIYSGYEVHVESVATNAITLEHALPAAPAAAVTFDILRRKAEIVSSSGGSAVSEAGRSYADGVRHDYAVNVTTGAWVEIIAVTAAIINAVMIFDSSGQTLELGVGGAGSEVRTLLIPPGGLDGVVPLRIAAGSRLALKAISANATAGEHVFQGLQ